MSTHDFSDASSPVVLRMQHKALCSQAGTEPYPGLVFFFDISSQEFGRLTRDWYCIEDKLNLAVRSLKHFLNLAELGLF